MIAGNTKEDENPSVASKHGVPYDHKNLIKKLQMKLVPATLAALSLRSQSETK